MSAPKNRYSLSVYALAFTLALWLFVVQPNTMQNIPRTSVCLCQSQNFPLVRSRDTHSPCIVGCFFRVANMQIILRYTQIGDATFATCDWDLLLSHALEVASSLLMLGECTALCLAVVVIYLYSVMKCAKNVSLSVRWAETRAAAHGTTQTSTRQSVQITDNEGARASHRYSLGIIQVQV